MSQNPIRDFLEACSSRLTWDDHPKVDDSGDVAAGDASPAEGETGPRLTARTGTPR